MGRCRPVKTFASEMGVERGRVMDDRSMDAIASGEYVIVLIPVSWGVCRKKYDNSLTWHTSAMG
jgi:hypothetical protein